MQSNEAKWENNVPSNPTAEETDATTLTRVHVVCHDCLFEGVTSSVAFASAAAREHENDVEHNVSVEVVQ